MIAQVLNREFLDSSLEDVSRMLARSQEDLESGTAGAEAALHGVGVDELESSREAVDELRTRGLDDEAEGGLASASISRDPVASIVQSALEAYFEEAGAVVRAEGQGLGPADVAITDLSLHPEFAAPVQRLGARLDQSDARWALSFLTARGIGGLRGKHGFSTSPARVTIANKARVILVGDWGSGIPRAHAVSEQMRAALLDAEGKGRERHVIHLGDVYFSGFARECQKRFLSHWPVEPHEKDTIGSWCLNGNHDMFSGGYGYFDCLLGDERFHRQANTSYFCLENEHWQIFGLDSAFDLHGLRGEEGDLYGPQAGWLATTRSALKKTLLLSHHQLFSSYESGSLKMEQRLDPILRPSPATAWFWGHEHLCATYARDAHPFVHHARLIGHGGVPVKPRTAPKPANVDYEFRDARDFLLNRFTQFGFAVLDFDEATIAVKYISELGGAPHHQEVIA